MILRALLLTSLGLLCASEALADQGYVYANNPNARRYTPEKSYSLNPSGQPIEIERVQKGRYRVRFNGMLADRSSGGNVQVSAYGPGAERCHVEGWTSGDGAATATVRCFDVAGRAADTRFTLLLTPPPAAQRGGKVAYAWGSKPNKQRYTAEKEYAHNPSGRAVEITRSGPGAYAVTFPGMSGAGGHAQVTSYGAGAEQCKVRSWNATRGGMTVNVGCFNSQGKAADARFSLLLLAP